LDVCGDVSLLEGEEYRYRGLYSLLYQLDRGVELDANLLKFLLSFRADGSCGEYLRGLTTNIFSRMSRYVEPILEGVFKEEMVAPPSKGGVSQYNFLILDHFLESMDKRFNRVLTSRLRSLSKDIKPLFINRLGYLLNVVNFVPFISHRLEEIRGLFSRASGSYIFLDSYDASLARKLLNLGGRAHSLSGFLTRLLDKDIVFLKKLPDLDILVVASCLESLKEDLRNYSYILDAVPNISYMISEVCIPSIYPYFLGEEYGSFIMNYILDLFSPGVRSNIVLTVDPYLYYLLSLVVKRLPLVIGFLPSLIVRVMSKI
jgi:hypothetical protein